MSHATVSFTVSGPTEHELFLAAMEEAKVFFAERLAAEPGTRLEVGAIHAVRQLAGPSSLGSSYVADVRVTAVTPPGTPGRPASPLPGVRPVDEQPPVNIECAECEGLGRNCIAHQLKEGHFRLGQSVELRPMGLYVIDDLLVQVISVNFDDGTLSYLEMAVAPETPSPGRWRAATTDEVLRVTMNPVGPR